MSEDEHRPTAIAWLTQLRDATTQQVPLHTAALPRDYQRYTLPDGGGFTRSGRCSVIVYWTVRARMKQ